MIETSNPNGLMRLGWSKRSLKSGDEITAEAYRAKDGSNTANPKTSRCVSNCQLSRRIQIGQRCAAPDV
jgi:Family of unknown function (DUF6152)